MIKELTVGNRLNSAKSMRGWMSITLSVIVLALGSQSAVADIYKVTKADGSVVFTDHPADPDSGNVEKLAIPSYSNSNNTSSQNNQQANSTSNRDRTTSRDTDRQNSAQRRVNYQITIESPSDERAYQQPAQSIDVQVKVSPALQNGDNVVIAIDGQPVASGLNASIPTASLLPGQHTLQVAVKYSDGPTTAAQSRNFYVIRTTASSLLRQQQLSPRTGGLLPVSRAMGVNAIGGNGSVRPERGVQSSSVTRGNNTVQGMRGIGSVNRAGLSIQ